MLNDSFGLGQIKVHIHLGFTVAITSSLLLPDDVDFYQRGNKISHFQASKVFKQWWSLILFFISLAIVKEIYYIL